MRQFVEEKSKKVKTREIGSWLSANGKPFLPVFGFLFFNLFLSSLTILPFANLLAFSE